MDIVTVELAYLMYRLLLGDDVGAEAWQALQDCGLVDQDDTWGFTDDFTKSTEYFNG